MSRLISMEDAIRAIEDEWDGCCSEYPATQIIYDTTEAIERLPIIQPEITHEQAVAYLQSTGWMQEHDRQMVLDGVHRLTAQLEPHWIPVEQALPEEPFGCLVTVMDTNPMTMEDFENILPYFVGWDGEQWNDGDGEQCPFEVLAWWGLPEPYKGVTE